MKGGLHSFGFRQRDAVSLVPALREVHLHPYEDDNALSENNKKLWDQVWGSKLLTKMPKQPGVRIGRLVRESLIKGDIDNWFVRSFFGRPSLANLPIFLLTQGHYPKNKKDDKVSFKYAELTETLEACRKNNNNNSNDNDDNGDGNKYYDFIHVSTILDGIKDGHRHKLLTAITDALSVGGIALFRTGPFEVDLNLNITQNYSPIRELVGKYLTVDHELSDRMKQNERCLIYYDVVFARKIKS